MLKQPRDGLLMPKLEEVLKDSEKQFGDAELTTAAVQRYRRVLGQLAWAALSRADLSFGTSFLARFQTSPPQWLRPQATMKNCIRWLLARLRMVQRFPVEGNVPFMRTVTLRGVSLQCWQSCALKFFSRKKEVPALSSAEAEVISICEAAKEMVSIGRLVETVRSELNMTP